MNGLTLSGVCWRSGCDPKIGSISRCYAIVVGRSLTLVMHIDCLLWSVPESRRESWIGDAVMWSAVAVQYASLRHQYRESVVSLKGPRPE